MDPQLQKAVAERITNGQSQASILNELQAAGYESAEAEQIYQTVYASLTTASQSDTSTASSGSVQQPPPQAAPAAAPTATSSQPQTTAAAAPVESSSTTNPTPAATDEPAFARAPAGTAGGHHWGLIITSVSILLLGGALIVAIMMGWHRPLLSTIGLGGAPYDEVTLLPGVFEQLTSPEHSHVQTEATLFIEEPEDGVAVGPDDLFRFVQILPFMFGIDIPETGSISLTNDVYLTAMGDGLGAQSQTDVRFDLGAQHGNLRARTIDDIVYIQFADISSDLESSLRMLQVGMMGRSLPSDTWIALTETKGGSGGRDDSKISQFGLGGFLEAMVGDFVSDADTIDPAQQDTVLDVLADAWQNHPLTAFRVDPYQETNYGETVYVYNVIPNVAQIEPFFLYVQNEVEQDERLAEFFDPTETEEFLDNDLAKLIDDLAMAEEYYDLRLYIRPDGSLQTIVGEAAIRASEEMSEQPQFRFQLRTSYDTEEGVTNLEVPADVQTLEEILDAASEKPEVPAQFQDIPDVTEGLVPRADELLADAIELYEETGSYDVCEAMIPSMEAVIDDFAVTGSGGSHGQMGDFYFANRDTNNQEHILGCISSDIGFSLFMNIGETNGYCIDDRGTDLVGDIEDEEFLSLCFRLGGGELIF